MPVFAYEAYKFIDPALYPHERKAIFPFIAVVAVLFIVGAIFGFFVLAPSFIQGFVPFYDAVNAVYLFPIMDFYNMVFFTIIVSGLLFTIPAFFVLLVKFGVLHTKTVTKQRKYLYAGFRNRCNAHFARSHSNRRLVPVHCFNCASRNCCLRWKKSRAQNRDNKCSISAVKVVCPCACSQVL